MVLPFNAGRQFWNKLQMIDETNFEEDHLQRYYVRINIKNQIFIWMEQNGR